MSIVAGVSIDSPEQLVRPDTASERRELSRNEAISDREERQLRYTALRRRGRILRGRSTFQEQRQGNETANKSSIACSEELRNIDA